MTWACAIGLEVHVQLRTASKLFCDCPTAFGDPPNANVCPVCCGLPGALPVTNQAAVRLGVRAALTLECTIHRVSEFARKQYFYPDLPKGYQISQFDRPLATDGAITIRSPERGTVRVGIQRVHLEEDAGKLLHDRVPGATAVDLNRCGVPLIEIVTDPDLETPAEARACLVALKQEMRYAGTSDCVMEEGGLRVDANLSVRRPGAPLGTKQELKNLNSFGAVERALAHLRDRQIAALDAGEAVTQQTLGVAPDGTLRAIRLKEGSPDYRYFPDPDLPPLDLEGCDIDVAAIAGALPERPVARRTRFRTEYRLTENQADVVTATCEIADHFEAVVRGGADPASSAHWVMGPVLADAHAHEGVLRVAPGRLAQLIAMVGANTVSLQAAKQVYRELAGDPTADPEVVARRLGLLQVVDPDRLAAWVDQVLDEHPLEAARLRAGERKLLGFLTGQVMALSEGRADPQQANALLRARLT